MQALIRSLPNGTVVCGPLHLDHRYYPQAVDHVGHYATLHASQRVTCQDCGEEL